MITPLDIQNKEFKKALLGYDIVSVETYLDQVLEEYESIYKENSELKDRVEMLSDHLRQYNSMEETLKSTLIVAQTTADEVIAAARKKGDNIVSDAELKAKEIINKAHKDVEDIKIEYENMTKEIYVFKTRFKSFIETQLLSLDDFYQDINNNHGNKKDYELENEQLESNNLEVDNIEL